MVINVKLDMLAPSFDHVKVSDKSKLSSGRSMRSAEVIYRRRVKIISEPLWHSSEVLEFQRAQANCLRTSVKLARGSDHFNLCEDQQLCKTVIAFCVPITCCSTDLLSTMKIKTRVNILESLLDF